MRTIVIAMFLACSVLGAAAVVPPALKPITVVLQDGEIVQGYFVGRDATTFTIQASDGKATDIAISKIKKAFDANTGEAMPLRASQLAPQPQPTTEASPVVATPELNTLPTSPVTGGYDSADVAEAPWFPQQPSRLVISLRGAYGFPTTQESSAQIWGATYSEYETGISASWESSWWGAGLGFNYEWHHENYSYTYDIYSGPFTYVGTYTDRGSLNWGVASLPICVEVFAPFKYVKPGIRFGADFYATDGIGQSTGMAFEVAPVIKIVQSDHFDIFVDCKFSRPLTDWSGEGDDFQNMGRWTIGTGVSLRL